MKYYILYLNDNTCYNKTKIEDVILTQEIPFDKNSNIYEPLEVLAYDTAKFYNGCMTDVLTGEKIYFDDGIIKPEITYAYKTEAKQDELIRIYDKYKNLSKEELKRYKDGLSKIKKTSSDKYKKYIKTEEMKNYKYENACNFMNKLIENNTTC